MLHLLLAAYYSKRLLLLQDTQSYDSFIDMLGRLEMPYDKFLVNSKFFQLPSLFQDGSPVYSHIVIAGENIVLSKEIQQEIARFVDGSDDADYSRFSNFEKETLVIDHEAKGIFAKQFDKYPGGHLLIATSSKLDTLIKSLGAKYGENNDQLDPDLKNFNSLLPNSKVNYLTRYLNTSSPCVNNNFKNSRSTFTGIFTNCTPIAFWRGVKNNARVVFVSTSSVLNNIDNDDDLIRLDYDIIGWFGLHAKLIRATSFDYQNLDLPAASECRKALHVSHFTKGTVREGGLVLIKLQVEEVNNKQWRAYQPVKKYESFDQMVEQVGFYITDNANHTSVMKKQTKSFKENYDMCMREIVKGEFWYTEVQVFEQFIQHWYAVNCVTNGNGTYFALLQPDLVRSYSIQYDIDRNEYNRINSLLRIDVHVDRYEENKFVLANSVWQICLMMNIALALYVVWLMISVKEEKSGKEAKHD